MSPDTDRHLPASMGNPTSPKDYALSGKIMLSAIVILFLVVLLMVTLHLYARWYLLRQRRRQLLLRRRSRPNGTRRAHVVFYADNDNPSNVVTGPNHPANKGLEPAVLGSLPVFAFSSKTHPDGLECAVCLSEFEEDEKGRILPACNHSFHTGCIDMWFHSHSTCPICRAAVEPVIKREESTVNLVVERADSSSGLCSPCRHEEGGSSSMAPLASRRKGLDLTGVRIEVPRMMSELEPELPLSSPAGHGFKSPGARLLYLKRILSMGRRTPTGSSTSSSAATPCGAAAGTSCSPAGTTTVSDLESGATELTRVQTPR